MDFIEANGVGLRCELSGEGDRTLVPVHEMGGSARKLGRCRAKVREIAPRAAL